MGTLSFVGVMIGDQCRAIYVHYDGYLDGVGADLQAYTTQDSVEEMISHGDRTSIEGPYYKDRGDDNVAPQIYKDFAEFFEAANDVWCEWYYIFKDGIWYCGNTYSNSELYGTLTAYAEACEMWLEYNN